MVHDTPILVYSVYQFIEEGLIPYQDLFEYNLPGTYLFFSVWSRLFGYNDLSFRILDVIWLAALLFTIYLITKRFGKYAAWFSVVLIGLS